LPVVERLKTRFAKNRICVVADRGMISKGTIAALEADDCPVKYIPGIRMRKVRAIRERQLSHPGRYKQVWPENTDNSKPAPLKVKQIALDDSRYIVCLTPRQQRKDAADREAIVSALAELIKKGPRA
jgi:hypothetical protein